MGFIDSYKHVEKICGEMLGEERPVAAYIDEMNKLPDGARYVSTWDSDLKQLKHYKWMRNQIVHNINCTEQNMCTPADENWLNEFYMRIMNQTDPLALYYKAQKQQSVKRVYVSEIPVKSEPYHHIENQSKDKSNIFGFVLITVLVLIVLFLFLQIIK